VSEAEYGCNILFGSIICRKKGVSSSLFLFQATATHLPIVKSTYRYINVNENYITVHKSTKTLHKSNLNAPADGRGQQISLSKQRNNLLGMRLALHAREIRVTKIC
jgi:hypothetical protein